MEPLKEEPSLTEGPLTRRAACMDYTGRAAQAVRRLKYERVTSHAALMSCQMAELAELTGLDLAAPTQPHEGRRAARAHRHQEPKGDRIHRDLTPRD